MRTRDITLTSIALVLIQAIGVLHLIALMVSTVMSFYCILVLWSIFRGSNPQFNGRQHLSLLGFLILLLAATDYFFTDRLLSHGNPQGTSDFARLRPDLSSPTQSQSETVPIEVHMAAEGASLAREMPSSDICHTFLAIRRLAPSDPSLAPMPLSLLGLDPSSYPFNEPANLAPLSNSRARETLWQAVNAALSRTLDPHWPRDLTDLRDAGRDNPVVDAVYLVSNMLLDIRDGPWFLSHVQPRLSMNEEGGADAEQGCNWSDETNHAPCVGAIGQERMQVLGKARWQFIEELCGEIWANLRDLNGNE